MVLLGLILALAGFLLSVLSLGVAAAPGARLALVVAGIAISLTGIIGMLNRAYIKNALWRR